jgi:secondary thiamine-phosphate synthase enzyme
VGTLVTCLNPGGSNYKTNYYFDEAQTVKCLNKFFPFLPFFGFVYQRTLRRQKLSTPGMPAPMPWFQRDLRLPARPRGFHLVTQEVTSALPELQRIKCGLLHVFIQHTSASLSINENADPDVPADLESTFNELAPDDFPYRHTIEGPDDMPAHIKASLLGSSVSVPIRDGRLALGTWQGIYLCEHRDRASPRTLVLTVHGE